LVDDVAVERRDLFLHGVGDPVVRERRSVHGVVDNAERWRRQPPIRIFTERADHSSGRRGGCGSPHAPSSRTSTTPPRWVGTYTVPSFASMTPIGRFTRRMSQRTTRRPPLPTRTSVSGLFQPSAMVSA